MSPQLSKTLLRIPANLSSSAVWVISNLLSKSSVLSLFSRFLGTVQRAPTMIGIDVTFMYYNFFSSQARYRYKIKLNLIWIRWSVFISESLKILCVSFSKIDSVLHTYHYSVLSMFNLLHNISWITFSTQSVMPALILWKFAAFSYYMTDYFIAFSFSL